MPKGDAMKWIGGVTLLLLCACCSMQAESAVYASFSAATLSVPNTEWEYGVTPGFYYDGWKLRRMHTGIDLRAVLLGTGVSKLESGLIGPRIHVEALPLNLKPYGETLFGGSHVTFIDNHSTIHRNSFEFQLLAGVDRAVSPRIDWRLAEVTWGTLTNAGLPFRFTTLSTGLVLRVP